MIALKTFAKAINKLIKEHPEWAELPLIYSADDEGNSYHVVNNLPAPMQVGDPKEYYIEPIGIYQKGSDEVAKEDINCIIIN